MASPIVTCLLGAYCMEPSAWAAWTQAVLSVAAVVVAICIPVAIRHSERRDHCDAVYKLMLATHFQMQILFNLFVESGVVIGDAGKETDLDRLLNALEAVPVHEIPAPNMILPVLQFSSISRHFQVSHNWLKGRNLATAAVPLQRQNLKLCLDKAETLLTRTRRVRDDLFLPWYRSSSERQRTKAMMNAMTDAMRNVDKM